MSSGGGEEPVVGGALTAEDAGRVLSSACAVVGLDATGAVLRRIGTHAVFRLASPVVVRITGAAEALARAERTVGVARWLAEVDFPAVRVLPGVEQPVVVAGRVVTFWVLIADEERWAELGQVGDLIRRLHWLEEPRALRLPRLDPLGETWRRIEGSVGLGADDRAFLWARAETLSKRYDELDFVLPFGMVHGDAQVGNALRDGSGRAVLIDLDGFAVGPREWDLVLTALYFERFGWHTRSEYDAFVHSYGFDVMNWYGYQTLADMRELMMTVWLSRGMTTDETVAAEVRRRIGDLRSGAERRGWQPF